MNKNKKIIMVSVILIIITMIICFVIKINRKQKLQELIQQPLETESGPANVRQVCVAGYNNISINIEGAGNFEAVMPPKEEEDAYAWLLGVLIEKYGLKNCDIWAHGELNPLTRSDPGRQFAKLMWDRLGGSNIQWQNHPECTNRPPIPGK
jgi:hypothetical protein